MPCSPALRADRNHRPGPRIFLTRRRETGYLREGMNLWRRDYLTETVSAPELLGDIGRWNASRSEFRLPLPTSDSPAPLEALGFTPREAEGIAVGRAGKIETRKSRPSSARGEYTIQSASRPIFEKKAKKTTWARDNQATGGFDFAWKKLGYNEGMEGRVRPISDRRKTARGTARRSVPAWRHAFRSRAGARKRVNDGASKNDAQDLRI